MGVASVRNVEQRTAAWQVEDLLVVVGLGLAALLSRLPFQAALMDSFDAINYALALEHFDMRLAQPQAPGYPLYILLGRLFLAVLGDPLQALVWLSMLSTALGVVAMYLVGKDMFSRRVGVLAALLTAVSTVVWYMGEIAAPYTPDLFASALTGWLCWRALVQEEGPAHWWAAVAVGLAGALRLQTLIFLFPLLLWALFAGRRRSFGENALAVAVAGMVFAAIFIPAIVVSGGLQGFLTSMRGILPIFRDADTVRRSVRLTRYLGNAITMARYYLRILGELSLPFVLLGLASQKSLLRPWRNRPLAFLLAWLLPSWMVYFFLWPGNLGTVLVTTPPLFLLAALGLDGLIERGRWGRALGWSAVALILALQVWTFVALPRAPFGQAYRTFDNAASLRSTVQSFQNRLDLVRALPVEGTLVVTDQFRHMQYYLPQYRTITLPRFVRDQPDTVRLVVATIHGEMDSQEFVPAAGLVPAGTERLAFWTLPDGFEIGPEFMVEQQSLERGSLVLVSVPAGRQVVWRAHGLSLASAP